MTSFKYLTYFVTGLYIFFELVSIIPQLSGPQTITVYKRTYTDSDAYIQGYKREPFSVEIFNIKVKPNGFWDRILLTDENENLLSDVLKVATAILFVFYIYNLRFDNIFSNKSFNIIWVTIFICVLSYMAYDIGADHTKDFFTKLYTSSGGKELTKYDFQRNSRIRIIDHNLWIYGYWIPFVIINLYKTFNKHHNGKPTDNWF